MGKARKTTERDKGAAMEAVLRGYLLCKFNREEVAADQADNRKTLALAAEVAVRNGLLPNA